MPKTHKPTQSNGVPKSRPVVGASSGLTTYIGDVISDILEPIAKIREDSLEAQSTEEVRRIIEDASLRSETEGIRNLVADSMDVIAL